MSNSDSLHERGSALENQFFAELDAKLLEELKSRQDQENAVSEFARITGIKDTKILEAVHKLGVSPQAFSALRVFPLVAVAWGDGVLEEAERSTINTLAAAHFDLKGPAGKLLTNWLETKPSSEMFTTWEAYAKGLM